MYFTNFSITFDPCSKKSLNTVDFSFKFPVANPTNTEIIIKANIFDLDNNAEKSFTVLASSLFSSLAYSKNGNLALQR